MKPSSLLVTALLTVTVLSGCAESASFTVDRVKAEALVARAARQVDVRARSVRCPDDVEGRKGVTFTCTITGRDGTSAKVSGEVTDEKDNGTIFVNAPLVNVGQVEGDMVAFLRKQVGSSVKVRCPEVVLGRKGKQFTCGATATRGRTADVRATIDKVSGDDITAAAKAAARRGTPIFDIGVDFKVIPTG